VYHSSELLLAQEPWLLLQAPRGFYSKASVTVPTDVYTLVFQNLQIFSTQFQQLQLIKGQRGSTWMRNESSQSQRV